MAARRPSPLLPPALPLGFRCPAVGGRGWKASVTNSTIGQRSLVRSSGGAALIAISIRGVPRRSDGGGQDRTRACMQQLRHDRLAAAHDDEFDSVSIISSRAAAAAGSCIDDRTTPEPVASRLITGPHGQLRATRLTRLQPDAACLAQLCPAAKLYRQTMKISSPCWRLFIQHVR